MIIGIETGGTKVICAIAAEDAPLRQVKTERFPTTSPDETISRIREFVEKARSEHPISGIGVASFGPLNVERDKPRYGWICETTKPGWSNTDLLGGIDRDSGVPCELVTDVSGAAIGESLARWDTPDASLAYATFGTGVGVGLLVKGRLLMGNGYPEMAHIRVERHPEDDFPGVCPFHGDCLEGLASGPATIGRWGADASSLQGADARQAREFLAWYIAQLVAALAFTFGPIPTVIGGGVLKTSGLLPMVRDQFTHLVGNALPQHDQSSTDLISAPRLGDFSGVCGALALVSPRRTPAAVLSNSR